MTLTTLIIDLRNYPQYFNSNVLQHLQSLKNKYYKWIFSHTMYMVTNESLKCESMKQK